MPAYPALAWLAALILLSGCAAPRYQTSSRLILPEGAAAQACLASCERALGTCRTRCSDSRAACLKTIDGEVERRYADALKDYADALDRYRMDLEHYRFQIWAHSGPGSRWWYDPWPPYVMPAMTPRPPEREAIRERVGQERCDRDCGCTPDYDACVIGCGGRKVEETRCIANCPSR